MTVLLGVKSDPIESRYSYDWLFGIMAEHHVTRLQYGASTAALVAEDAARVVLHDNWSLFEAQMPAMWEFHFKNTDAIFNGTFGFGESDRGRGIVDLARLKTIIDRNARRFPRADEIVGYLEISGPKVGRDYADGHLGALLSESLTAIRDVFPA